MQIKMSPQKNDRKRCGRQLKKALVVTCTPSLHIKRDRMGKKAIILIPIEWGKRKNHIVMCGAAAHIFRQLLVVVGISYLAHCPTLKSFSVFVEHGIFQGDLLHTKLAFSRIGFRS